MSAAPPPEPPDADDPDVGAAAPAPAPADAAPPGITAVLEAANALRKQDSLRKRESLREQGSLCRQDEGSAGDDHGRGAPDVEDAVQDVVEAPGPDPAPPVVTTGGGRPAYTPATAAAIAALTEGKGAPPPAVRAGGAPGSPALTDRAAAVLSVYKDYLREEDPPPKEERGAATHAPACPAELGSLRYFRREEIKEAALDKFCIDSADGDGDGDGDSDEQSEGEGEEDGGEDDDDFVLHGRRRHASRAPRLPLRRALRPPTAATTAAAFRLRAAAALGAARTAAGRVRGGRGHAAATEDALDFRRRGEEEEDRALVQDERQEDMEYGVHDAGHNGTNPGKGAAAVPAVYGMHILDRDQQSFKRKRRADDDGAVDAFNGLCDELGVTPATHPSIHRFYSTPRSGRYRYPIFRAEKFRRALVYGVALILSLLVVVALVSAATNGFEKMRLPEYQEDLEWRARQKQEWEQEHYGTGRGGPRPEGAVAATGNNDNHADSDREEHAAEALREATAAAYRPVWYDRSTGWTGRTYREARTFCGTSHIPCPYAVYCPGQGTLIPGGGFADEGTAESWAPVADLEDEWVRVVDGNGGAVCELYSRVHGRSPGWKGGEDNEAMTRHIMCCREHPLQEGSVWDEAGPKPRDPSADTPPTLPSIDDEMTVREPQRPGVTTPPSEAVTMLAFLTVAGTYNPTWYHREDGWEGRTYQDSLEFCARTEGYIPCPYEAYCPGGLDGELFGGIQDQEESWSAAIDDQNEWVQVGKGGECLLYSEIAGELPNWGMTGENNEEITRHIMCCLAAPHFSKEQNEPSSQEAHGVENTITTPAPTVLSNNNPDSTVPPLVTTLEPHRPMTPAEAKISQQFRPSWFDTNSGWKGTTYNEARTFCNSIPQEAGGTLRLCPLAAYCPNSLPTDEPLYLQMPPFDGIQWAPTSDKDNDWVMVGDADNGELVCLTYKQINHRDPPWDLDETSPQLKEHILCCENDADSSANSDDVEGAHEKLINEVIVESGNSESSGSVDTLPSQENALGSSMTILELKIQDLHHPAWFSTAFGWQGTTYNDAKAFCESIPHGNGDSLHLCPLAAYCPNGPRDTEPLYLQMDAFNGVQWAPINEENEWVMIGNIDDGEHALTCQTYRQINHRDPEWGLDGTSAQSKQNLLCCEDDSLSLDDGDQTAVALSDEVSAPLVDTPLQGATGSFSNTDGDYPVRDNSQQVNTQPSIIQNFYPIWFDADQGGWEGGSHEDAIAFCDQFEGAHGKNMKLCPYVAYCPSGPSHPVIGGHAADFFEEGEQWAPVFGESNHWVLIGKRGQNDATTCLSHTQLMGQEPLWGLDGSNRKNTKHLMCCSPLQ